MVLTSQLGYLRRMNQETPSTIGKLKAGYARLSLSQRFAAVGGLVMLAASVVMAVWVSKRIEHGVVANTASATALYMESVISPASQELARSDVLSPGAVQALTEIFRETPMGEQVVSYKIWKPGGLIAYASNPDLIGKTFTPDNDLRTAWSGKVVASFSELDGEEAAAERSLNRTLLEVYSPIREVWSGKVIAVAEFYEVADDLERELLRSRTTTWIMVALTMASASLALFGIVQNGSRTIARQQQALTGRVRDLGKLVEQNRLLRQRVEKAAARGIEMNERYLQRISADLHDGPAQLLSLGALRLDSVIETQDHDERRLQADAIRKSLNQAMTDIRNICRGLTLPELDSQTTGTVIRRAIADHQARTGDAIEVATEALDSVELDHSRKISVFRFLQEALSNASRHGEGKNIRVEATGLGTGLEVTVRDDGPGFSSPRAEDVPQTGLGLQGLRNRIESQGGRLEIRSNCGRGTCLSLRFDQDGEEHG